MYVCIITHVYWCICLRYIHTYVPRRSNAHALCLSHPPSFRPPNSQPKVTLSGLATTNTSDATLDVSLTYGGESRGVATGLWESSDGTLVFNILQGPISAGYTVAAGNTLNFEIAVTNSRFAQSPVVPTINLTLSTTIPAQAYTSPSYDVDHDDASTPDFSQKSVSGGLTAITNHSELLRILPVTFVGGIISQGSSTPCESNVITISLKVDAFLVSGCISPITVTGLSGSATADTSGLTVTSDGKFAASADWKQSGSLQVRVAENLQAGESVSFTFTLANPAAPQSNRSTAVSEANVIGSSNPRGLIGEALRVEDVGFDAATVEQSAGPGSGKLFEPCGSNLITVRLTPDKRIYKSCNGAAAYFEVRGLMSSSTPSQTLNVSDDAGGHFDGISR